MPDRRYLIVNADDFGQSPGINQGIIQAHEQGIVTSASLMVRWPAAGAAAAYGRAHPEFAVGLHVDLGEWAYRDQTWVQLYQVVADEPAALVNEVNRQLATFRELLGRDPTHLDSHQHVHMQEPARSVLAAVACRLGVLLRRCTAGIRYCGSFYGQTDTGEAFPEGIQAAALVALLKRLPAGFTELACHPGVDGDVDSMYRSERAQEVRALCDPEVRAIVGIEGIILCSFHHPGIAAIAHGA